MSKLRELMRKRAKALSDARAINDAAAAAGAMTTEQRSEYDRHMSEFQTLGEQIEREETLAREESAIHELADELVDQNTGGETRGGNGNETKAQREMRGLATWLRSGMITPEFRALQVDADVSGGYLQTPQQMVESLLKAVDNRVFIRQLATVYRVPNAESLGVPSLDADPADPTRTTEILSGNEDSTMAFGKRKLTPTPFAVRLKSSETLLRKVPNVASLIEGRIAYKMGVVDENSFLNGSGANEPLGLFTASANGVSTSRDVNTHMTTTAPTFDGLMTMKYTLNDAYWNMPSTRWLFHPDVMLTIALIKDGEGRYMLRESLRAGEPDTLLNIPIALSRYAPNTLTAGLYFGLLGDMSYYWIADSLDLRIKRVSELYAETDQVGFFARAEDDGMPVLAEAFVRGKLAS